MSATQASAQRAYFIGTIACFSIYGALCFGAPQVIAQLQPKGPALMTIAALPALPVLAFFFYVFPRFLMRVDEYQRSRVVLALLLAIGAMLALATVWDFLESSGGFPAPRPFIFTTGFILAFGVAVGALQILEKFNGRS